MKKRFDYQAKGLYFIGVILLIVATVSLSFLLRNIFYSAKDNTALYYFVISLFSFEFIIVYFIRDEHKWSKIRTEHDFQNFADLNGQKCKIISIEKYVDHYQLYFDSNNKRYALYLNFEDKELSCEEKIILRTNVFYFKKNISNVEIIPTNDISLRQGMTHHYISFIKVNNKKGYISFPSIKKEFI